MVIQNYEILGWFVSLFSFIDVFWGVFALAPDECMLGGGCFCSGFRCVYAWGQVFLFWFQTYVCLAGGVFVLAADQCILGGRCFCSGFRPMYTWRGVFLLWQQTTAGGGKLEIAPVGVRFRLGKVVLLVMVLHRFVALFNFYRKTSFGGSTDIGYFNACPSFGDGC